MGFLTVPDHLGTDKNDLERTKFFEENAFFFDPKIGLFAHKLGQNGVHWGGLQGQFSVFEGPGPFGSRNNANKKIFGKKILAIFGPKGKFLGLPPPPNKAKIGPQGPSRVLGAIFGPSGTLSDPIGALSGS